MVKRHVRLDDQRQRPETKVKFTKEAMGKMNIPYQPVAAPETLSAQIERFRQIIQDSNPSLLQMTEGINRVGFSARRLGRSAAMTQMSDRAIGIDRVEREDQDVRQRSMDRMRLRTELSMPVVTRKGTIYGKGGA